MNPDALDDVVTSIKRTRNHGVYGNFDSVICVKSSLLLHVSSKHIFSPNAAFNFLYSTGIRGDYVLAIFCMLMTLDDEDLEFQSSKVHYVICGRMFSLQAW